jgi:hypothetical protein
MIDKHRISPSLFRLDRSVAWGKWRAFFSSAIENSDRHFPAKYTGQDSGIRFFRPRGAFPVCWDLCLDYRGVGDREVGHVVAETEVYCVVCSQEQRRQTRIESWEEGE